MASGYLEVVSNHHVEPKSQIVGLPRAEVKHPSTPSFLVRGTKAATVELPWGLPWHKFRSINT